MWKKDEPEAEAFKQMLRLEADCYKVKKGKPVYTPHRWRDHRWLTGCRVWIERCAKCGAIRIWRVNDSIYYDAKRGLHFFHLTHKDFNAENYKETFLKALEEAGYK